MCYEQPPCEFFWFDPLTGRDGCNKHRHAVCTADQCPECGAHVDVCECTCERCEDGVRWSVRAGGWVRCECET